MLLRLLSAMLLAALLLAPTAGAASRSEIIADCSLDGRLDGSYSPSEIRDARRNLPADVDEYTDCRDVMREAELAGGGSSGGGAGGAAGGGGTGGGGTGGGGGGGGSGLLTVGNPEEQSALDEARTSGGGRLSIGGRAVTPGAAGLTGDAARHSLPAPLLAVLILLGLVAAATVAPRLQARVRRGHTA